MLSVYSLRAADDAVTFIVTKDFAPPPLVEKKVPDDGRSCMKILQDSAGIETACGGSFVVSIEGIGGEDRNRAWFYYVNGLLADVGASGCVPRPGDVIQWDYHSWASSNMVSAIIGSYPQPFLSGGCSILYAAGAEDSAKRIAGALTACGAKEIAVLPLDINEPAMPVGHVILVGTIGDIQKTKDFGDVVQRAGRLLESPGAGESARPAGVGAIVAYKDGWGRTARAVWLVTGTGEDGVLRAVDLLDSNPREIAFMAGAVMTAEGVRNVPAP